MGEHDLTLEETRPRIRESVRHGPPLYSCNGVVRYLKDPASGMFVRLRAKEYFVVSRLDGSTSLREIGDAYQAEFGRRLTDSHFRTILELLGQRGLLEVPGLAATRHSTGAVGPRVVPGRRALFDPDRVLGLVEPRLRPLLRHSVVVPVLVLVATMVVAVLTHLESIAGHLAAAYDGVVPLLLAVAVVGALTIVHELGHGLVCKRYGGRVPEIGIAWFPAPRFYCSVDDVVLFTHRRHRVHTAGAGVVAGLLCVLPFAALAWGASLLAWPVGVVAFLWSVVLLGILVELVNLLPVARLDGYMILMYSQDMLDLRESAAVWWADLARTVLRRNATPTTLPPQRRRVALLYGVLRVVVVVGLVVAFLWTTRVLLTVAPVAGVLVLALSALSVANHTITAAVRRRATPQNDRSPGPRR